MGAQRALKKSVSEFGPAEAKSTQTQAVHDEGR
jgi:hypothetical protein